jgi:hypothetical protein
LALEAAALRESSALSRLKELMPVSASKLRKASAAGFKVDSIAVSIRTYMNGESRGRDTLIGSTQDRREWRRAAPERFGPRAIISLLL